MAEISKIKLPSGTIYDIKDAVAREMLSAGVSFIVAWDGTTPPEAAKIPAGVVVNYNGVPTTGTLATTAATAGSFYLVKSETRPSGDAADSYDEYVVIKPDVSQSTTWYWEKIGDTKLNLTDVVTEVSLTKKTDGVIGENATFTVTQPTITLATGAASEGSVEVVTGVDSISATGDEVTALTGLGTPTTEKVIGTSATLKSTQPTIALATNDATASGRVQVVTGITPTTTNLKATASGAETNWNSKDEVDAVTGYTPTDDTFVKTVSATTKKLVTASITGVSGSTTASKATAGTDQTTAVGTGTASTNNTDWLKNVSVTSETLIIGAATMDTQTTTQYTFADVTVPQAATATRVATGAVADSDANGAAIVTSATAGTTGSALTGLGTPTTKGVIGADSTFTVVQPAVALATNATAGTGVVSVATGMTPATTYLGATASGGKTEWNVKDEKTVVTGYASPTTDAVLGTASTITATANTTNIKATASGANTAWNNKDAVTVLTDASDIVVNKGQQ